MAGIANSLLSFFHSFLFHQRLKHQLKTYNHHLGEKKEEKERDA